MMDGYIYVGVSRKIYSEEYEVNYINKKSCKFGTTLSRLNRITKLSMGGKKLSDKSPKMKYEIFYLITFEFRVIHTFLRNQSRKLNLLIIIRRNICIIFTKYNFRFWSNYQKWLGVYYYRISSDLTGRNYKEHFISGKYKKASLLLTIFVSPIRQTDKHFRQSIKVTFSGQNK